MSGRGYSIDIPQVSRTNFTEDLKGTTTPGLVRHGDDDQIVPYTDSGLRSAGSLPFGEGQPGPSFRASGMSTRAAHEHIEPPATRHHVDSNDKNILQSF
ncbi:hypothetical protein CFB43_24465 [Burkholderia sp. AU15512]|nr:hypothetical protein CFB43_24465 [Burkholderia sp. AU15512]